MWEHLKVKIRQAIADMSQQVAAKYLKSIDYFSQSKGNRLYDIVLRTYCEIPSIV